MDENGKFMEKMIELGVGMSIIQQIPTIFKDVMSPLAQSSDTTTSPAVKEPVNSIVQIYLAIDKKQVGPFTNEELVKLIQNDILRPNTLVWKVGMNNWSPASQVAEVNKLFILSKLK